MATRFELVLHGSDEAHLRAAGEEAIDEIHRLDNQLSAFRPVSAVSRINDGASEGPVTVTPELFDLLTRIRHLSDITHGAFDVTVGPLLAIWGFRGESRSTPDESEVAGALGRVGISHLDLDPQNRTVSFDLVGMKLDLGGIGKGYALDVAAEVLLSAGVSSALLHGGTSSVRAIGLDPDGFPWKVAVHPPFGDADPPPVDIVALENEAMSVSAVSGKFFEADGRIYGHVIDPRTGYPTQDTDLAVVVTPTAVDADALSTGLLVLGAPGIPELTGRVPGFHGTVYN